MKISYHWLKEYINVDLPAETIAGLLTGCGLEVEGIIPFQSVKGGLNGVVIGEVLTCVKHPNSDHLSLTTVNIGKEEPLKIVCGAANVAAGQKVPVAVVGTKLFIKGEELTIKEAKIRGEQSFGMICAEDELGLGESHAGIMVLDSSAVPGTPAKEYFHVTEDEVFEIGLTPNRSDATSHMGVARDLATVMNHLSAIGQGKGATLTKPDISHFKADNMDRVIDVIVEDTTSCPRYSGLTISNVTVKESPDWLKSRLQAIGLRPINNIVDITNYILHETGQPLHAFDADKITGGKVIIKKLSQGTPFVTLDEVPRELSADDLMICNAEKPMCIAGVFGGIESGVSMQTKNLFLESAYFDPKTIRKTSKRHGLQTDASFRFERGADPDITVFALKRAALLMKEVAGGEISSDVVDVYPNPFSKPQVDFSWSNLDRLTGQFIPRSEVTGILQSLGIELLKENPEGLTLLVPSFKVDVLREVDIIEEIIRIYGYNNIGFSAALNSSVSFVEKPDREKIKNVVSDFLSSNGFYEIMNNSLTRSEYYQDNPVYPAQQSVKILNPLSRDLDVMRQTLLYGGLESIVYNQNRRSPDLRFYEFGNTYRLTKGNDTADPLHNYHENTRLALFITGRSSKETWNRSAVNNDFFDLKGYLNAIILRMGIDALNFQVVDFSSTIIDRGMAYTSNDEMVACFGKIRKEILTAFDCKQDVYYADVDWDLIVSLLPIKEKAFRELPKYPEVRRDLALLLDREVTFAELERIAFDTEKRLLNRVSLFDVYEGDKIAKGKKSYALSYILQDLECTLKDDEIDSIMQKIIKQYAEKLNATLR